MATFYERLQGLREEKGLTQVELAKAMGWTRQSITNYEGAGRQPEFQKLISLADFFNVSVDYLIGRSPFKTSQDEQDMLLNYSDAPQPADGIKALYYDSLKALGALYQREPVIERYHGYILSIISALDDAASALSARIEFSDSADIESQFQQGDLLMLKALLHAAAGFDGKNK